MDIDEKIKERLHQLHEKRQAHRRRSPLVRVAFVISGFLILMTGLAMFVLPGPAIVVIPIGLAILALEFKWAEKMLEQLASAIGQGAKLMPKFSRTQLILMILVGVVFAGIFTYFVFIV